MVVFMLRNDDTGKWYRRGEHVSGHWYEQQQASVWPSPQGPIAARTSVRCRVGQSGKEVLEMTVVEFELVPTQEDQDN